MCNTMNWIWDDYAKLNKSEEGQILDGFTHVEHKQSKGTGQIKLKQILGFWLQTEVISIEGGEQRAVGFRRFFWRIISTLMKSVMS